MKPCRFRHALLVGLMPLMAFMSSGCRWREAVRAPEIRTLDRSVLKPTVGSETMITPNGEKRGNPSLDDPGLSAPRLKSGGSETGSAPLENRTPAASAGMDRRDASDPRESRGGDSARERVGPRGGASDSPRDSSRDSRGSGRTIEGRRSGSVLRGDARTEFPAPGDLVPAEIDLPDDSASPRRGAGELPGASWDHDRHEGLAEPADALGNDRGDPRSDSARLSSSEARKRFTNRVAELATRLHAIEPARADEFLDRLERTPSSERAELLQVTEATLTARERTRPGETFRTPGDVELSESPRDPSRPLDSRREPPYLGDPSVARAPVRAAGAWSTTQPTSTAAAGRRSIWELGAADGATSASATSPESMTDPYRAEQERIRESARNKGSTVSPARSESARLKTQVGARVMALLEGDRTTALEPLDAGQPEEREFWRQLMFGLDRYFAEGEFPRDEHRLSATVESVEEAVSTLSRKAALECSVPKLCSQVWSFQKYREFPNPDFTPGQEVILYWEVRNFASEKVRDGWKTRLQPRIELVNPQGRTTPEEYSSQEETTEVRRRDYFFTIRYRLPKDLAPGDHTLRVITSDRLAERTVERDVPIRVVRAGASGGR